MRAKDIFTKYVPKDSSLVKCKYGKINKDMFYEIGTSSYYIYGERPVRVTILTGSSVDLTLTRVFNDEKEPQGGQMPGKTYKSAEELAFLYIKELKDTYSRSTPVNNKCTEGII